MPSTSIVSSLVSKPLGTLLKPHAFKKKALIFRRTVEHGPEIISCQTRAASRAGEAMFVLNLGASFPEVERLLSRRTPAEPKEFECTVRTRVGPAGKGDRWWTVSDEVPRDLEKRVAVALAWFDDVAQLSTLQTMLEQGDAWAQDRLVPTALAIARGERALAQRLLTALVRSVQAEREARASTFARDPFGLRLLQDAAKLAEKHDLRRPS